MYPKLHYLMLAYLARSLSLYNVLLKYVTHFVPLLNNNWKIFCIIHAQFILPIIVV